VEITGASRDITSKKRAEEALKASEAKYRQLTEGLKDVVLVVLPDFTIDYISPAVIELGGYYPEEMTGRHFSDYFEIREEYDLAIALLEEIIRNKKPTTNLEFLFKARNRDPLYVEITAKPIVKDNRVVLIQCVARDISERKKAEEDLRKREERLSLENMNLRKSIQQSGRFANIIGRSNAMMDVYDLLLKTAPTNLNTIIYGESGTGKELIARAIHDLSDRNKGAFVPVNCGAIAENIIESEFFGYSKGAFTGAAQDRAGFLDLADGGTLFLDEIGEIGLNMQVKLLRAIEGGGYTPVGSNRLKQPDIRIVAATNRDLVERVKTGKMRSDFFFRINIIRIDLPPLRERPEDIPLLVGHFIRKSRQGSPITRFPQDVMDYMIKYRWPGNVRELQNVVNQYLALKQIVFSSFGPDQGVRDKDIQHTETISGTLASRVNDFERKIILNQLVEHEWNKSKVSKILNIDRKTLDAKIKKYAIENKNNGLQ
jgi:PAS domain S-box-containing protein